MVQEHPEYTYQIIAEKVGVSLRYVKNVVKAEGLQRYNIKIDAEDTEKGKN